MNFGLVHASYSLPKWQAVKLTFLAPCGNEEKSILGKRSVYDNSAILFSAKLKLFHHQAS